MKIVRRFIWIAHNKKEIVATWYPECVQPFLSWKKAVRNIAPEVTFSRKHIDLEFK